MLSPEETEILSRACERLKSNPAAARTELPWFVDFVHHFEDICSSSDDEEAPPDTLGQDEASADARFMAENAARLLRAGDVESALEQASKSIEINPDSVKALRVRGKALNELKRYKEAVADLSAAQRIDFCEEIDMIHRLVLQETSKELAVDGTANPQTNPPASQMPSHLPQMPEGIDLAAAMNNPHVMRAAQQIMQDPSALASLQKMFEKR